MPSPSLRPELPPEILTELRKYREHRRVTCLECGYADLMGIQRTIKPWYGSTWFVILMILSGVGILLLLALGLSAGLNTKHMVVCPNCKKLLGPV
jgi:hypothetical protein